MPSMTQNDFLNFLFSLHPILVGLIIWAISWGSLLPIEFETNSSILFRNPIGYFVLLPLTGILITYFYQSFGTAVKQITSTKFTYSMLALSALITGAITLYSILTNHYNGIWSIPHTLGISFTVYIITSFIFKGFLQLFHSSFQTRFLIIYIVTLVIVLIHILLGYISRIKV